MTDGAGDGRAEDGLRGRTALVTGASRGIGRRIAERMAEAGARVTGVGRSEVDLRDLAGATGGASLVVDLTDDVALWDALDEWIDEHGGPPDIVVNAAGTFSLETLATETLESFDRGLAVNVRAPFIVMRALLPGMLERGSGLFVNVGSVAGRKALPGNSAYATGKYGLRGLHEVLLEPWHGARRCSSRPPPTPSCGTPSIRTPIRPFLRGTRCSGPRTSPRRRCSSPRARITCGFRSSRSSGPDRGPCTSS